MWKIVFQPETLQTLPGAGEVRRFVEESPADGKQVELFISQLWRDAPITLTLRIDGSDPAYGQMEQTCLYSPSRSEEVRQTLKALFTRRVAGDFRA